MKKIMLGLLVAAALTGSFSSCKKKENNIITPTPVAEQGYWKMGSTTHKSVKGSKYNDMNGTVMLSCVDSNTFFADNECNIYFSKYPTQNGTYKIVDDADMPEADELTILVKTKSDWFYSKNGGTATVTVNSGKITVTISGIKVYTSGDDEVEDFSCKLIQTQ